MQVDLVAEYPHYRDHLLPIWRGLPEAMRGTDAGTGPAARTSDRLLLVAGYSELDRHPHRRCIYVEHGAGQSYIGLPASVAPFYSPIEITKQHRNVILFLCPNDEVRDRWARSYGDIAVTVGCPKLDPWHAGHRSEHEPRTIAITFHWETPFSVVKQVPELQSGWEHYCLILRDQFIPRAIANGWTVLCHWHPRLGNRWESGGFKELGVEIVADSNEILDRAAILIADNTSLSAEMMSLGRGVVFLNHPAYHKDVEHGGRFWQWPKRTGVQIDTPASLVALDLDTVPDSTWHPYAYADGRATERAVAAILSLA